MTTPPNPGRTCPECGQPLPADAPEGLCPECLMVGGLGTVSLERKPEGEHRPEGHLPAIGEIFGGYRIVRELGRGGMGAVFEVEQLETGRRVALKLLNHQLDSPEARARFLREGRLAASINHPNSVYVYGTEEIEGMPAIAMELVAGGTLEERVKEKGPLPVGVAVDAILQMIAGLEAAQAIGILHRDIKPGNCFEDADGSVKIGDFGLSISTEARGETHLTLEGAILGTPAFASPEQLRGEELNARSDIYSVGATLYYLLTGRTPFRGKTLAQIFANVLEGDAPSPSEFQPKLPVALVKAVMRCLEKTPGERFKDYAELRAALVPFASEAPVPAPIPLRFLAGAVDWAIISGISMIVQMTMFGGMGGGLVLPDFRLPTHLWAMGGGYLASVFYFTFFEGIWGAGLGKAICRMRVAGPDRNPPGLGKAFCRTLVIMVLPALPMWIYFGFDASLFYSVGSDWKALSVMFSVHVFMALLFVTARHRNGLASVHDLLTNTRVVRRRLVGVRSALQVGEVERVTASEETPKVGPFHILESLGRSGGGEWYLGYDSRLLRKVWVRAVDAGVPPVPVPLRQLGRVGRLRWIAGMRSEEGNWDAFEAPGGRCLADLLREEGPQPWSRVRYWLIDIAREMKAAKTDGTAPGKLSLERVWVTAEGRAKLLDFPAPGKVEEEEGLGFGDLMTGVAGTAAAPLPMHARGFRDQLPALGTPSAVVKALQPLLAKFVTVSRARRAAIVMGCAAFPLLALVGYLMSMRMVENWQADHPDIMPLQQILAVRQAAKSPWMPEGSMPEDRLFSIYISETYRDTIEDEEQWTSMFAMSLINGEKRRFAEEAVSRDWKATPSEIRKAKKEIGPHGRDVLGDSDIKSWFPVMVAAATLLMYVAIPAVLLSLICRGGLVLLISGVAVARADGERASRWRVFWRSLVAWVPLVGIPVAGMALLYPVVGQVGAVAVAIAMVLGLVALSLWLPGRGLQDRIAGTVLVPR